MEFLGLQIHVPINHVVLVSTSSQLAAAIPPNFPIAKPNCTDRCGNVSIPFPFGTTKDCYQSDEFLITCNRSFNPARAFMKHSKIHITDISLDGQLKVMHSIAHKCYARNQTEVLRKQPRIRFSKFIVINNKANKLTVVGCDTSGYVAGWRFNRSTHYRTGCNAVCKSKDDLSEGSCTGLGCCQTSIPKQVRRARLKLKSYEKYRDVWDFNNCGYAFVAEESVFTFHPDNLTNLYNVVKLPMVVDWAIGNGTCEEAQMNSSTSACKSVNSTCYKPDNGLGYRCLCPKGYKGNPYLVDGYIGIPIMFQSRVLSYQFTPVHVMVKVVAPW